MSVDDDGEEGQVERGFTVLYGSQTGNAQDVAERIARQARRRRMAVKVQSMDEYAVSNLINESLVFFILSTTGQGDFPTSSLSFWKFLLRADLPSDILCDLTFITFGLGDSSYPRYCWPIRKLRKRLIGLGAQEVVSGAEADDQHFLGIDGTLQPWLSSVWQALEEGMPLPEGLEIIPDDVPLEPTVEVRLEARSSRSNGMGAEGGDQPRARAKAKARANGMARKSLLPGWQWARLVKNERMTKEDHWQDVRLIELEDVDDNPLPYQGGDVVAIRPENGSGEVERFLIRMGWLEIADSAVSLHPSNEAETLPSLLPPRTTLRQLATSYLDISSVPRQSFFEQLRYFSPKDHREREKLNEFCTPGEGVDDMYDYAQRVRRTIVEVLEEFTSVDVPLKYIFEVFPLMREREFSIASSSKVYPTKLQLAIAMVKYKTRLKEPRKGVITSWLSQLDPLMGNIEIPIHLKRGILSLPTSNRTPCIFVGPGTGVAPMRSFIQERLDDLSKQRTKEQDCCDILFLGCRNREKDWLFSKEWKRLEEEKKLQCFLAASRDQEEKVYVQDLIRREASLVWDVLGRRGGYFYISGSSGKMPEAVKIAVQQAVQQYGEMEEEQAQRFLTVLESAGRWQEECWS